MRAFVRRFVSPVAAIAMTVWAVVEPMAQQGVDFSGTWVPVTPPKGKREVQEIVVIVQDRTGMTASFGGEGRKDAELIRYEFGKSKVQDKERWGEIEVTVTSSWKGERLVAVNTVKVQDRTRTFEQVWSLDTSGRLLIQVTQAANPSEPRTTVYKRRPPAKSQ